MMQFNLCVCVWRVGGGRGWQGLGSYVKVIINIYVVVFTNYGIQEYVMCMQPLKKYLNKNEVNTYRTSIFHK